MTDQIKSELDQITAAVKAHCNPVAIYLFGSYAYGTPHKDSDLDIYVVVPDSVADTFFLTADILGSLDAKVMPMDLLVGRQERFENRKNRLTLEKTIYNEGIKIYG